MEQGEQQDESLEPEEQLKQETEVWLIDDEDNYREAMILRFKSIGNITFNTFDTAKGAIKEIEERTKKGGLLPQIIFIDGKLDKDKGEEIDSGMKVVEVIRGMEIPQQPYLIAHSNENEMNKSMKRLGANKIIDKGSDIKKRLLEVFQALNLKFGT